MTSISINKYKFNMDNYYKSNLDVALKEAIPNKWDFLQIVLGGEGVGKTTLSTQTSLYLNNKFSIKTTVFSTDQFDEAIEKANEEDTILWDEAITGANIKNHADQINIMLISKLTQIRYKKLKIILCIPYLYLLDKYFISRCLCGIYVYAKDFNDRGYAFFYNQPQMEYLYFLQKVKYPFNPNESYKFAQKSFHFKFPETFCLPEKEYEIKKAKSRTGEFKNKYTNKTLIEELLRRGIKVAQIVEIVKVSDVYVYKVKKGMKNV